MQIESRGELDRVVELDTKIKVKLTSCLVEVGHSEEIAGSATLTRVDHYHDNCFNVTINGNDGPGLAYVLKLLDSAKAWDTRENVLRREHDVGFFAAGIVPELKPRLFAGWASATEGSPALILYSYLGEAATYIKDSEQTLEILSALLPSLVKLHTKTVSGEFGKSLNKDGRKGEQYPQGVGAEIVRFLLNDIERDRLDPTGEILGLIKDKWIPVLDKEEVFSLTHKDVTMSNVIVKDGRPISLIDWTYSRWEDPAYDLAYLAFWCITRGRGDEIRNLLNQSLSSYHEVGLYPEKTLSFFLAFKCIEYGRYIGKDWVSLGHDLLNVDSSDAAFSLMAERLKERS